MRQKISLILLICVTIYMGGYHLIYAIYQEGLKQEMKAYIKLHQDAAIGNKMEFDSPDGRINDANFSWEEEGAEFRYKGEYYDVVSIRKDAGKITVICLKDGQENQLEQQWQKIHQQKHPTTESPYSRILKCFSCFVIIQNQDSIRLDQLACSKYPLWMPGKISEQDPAIQLPPPRA